jgi:two-component system phosphate regulon sensor histidine kinase PhoR
LKRIQAKIFLLLVTLFVILLAIAFLFAGGAGGGTARTSSLLVVVIGSGLLGALLASARLARMTLDPLEQIREVVAELTSGNLDRRLHWRTGDERDEVAISINRMADHLARQIDEARQEAQQLEAVMASMVEGVLVLDLSGRIMLANPGFRELLGVWGPVEGRSVLEVIRNAQLDEVLSEARAGGAPVTRDIEIRAAQDRTLLTHARGFPLSGPRAGTLAVFHDVTEIRRVDRIRRDFIANASHELRTPLTSIQGFAETLSSSKLSHEEMEPYLSVILRNARRMANLIDDLMSLSRIESGTTAVDHETVDICRVARTLLSDMQPRIAQSGIQAKLLTETAPAAWADRRAIEQVLENLLTNALRYTDEGGAITVDVETRGELLEVCVADTGIGIPEKSRNRIFERFYRVDEARSRAVGSTGLGLAITKHLVQAMGGTIRVESELGVGSRFIFSVPRAREGESPSSSGAG